MKKINILMAIAAILFTNTYCDFANASHETACPTGSAETSLCWECGDNCIAELDASGKMKIKGTGPMWGYDYYNQKAPWTSQMSKISSLEIDDGITSVGAHNFYGANKLKDLYLSDSVQSLGYCSFQGVSYNNVVLSSNSKLNSVNNVFDSSSVNILCKGDLDKCEAKKGIYDNLGKQTSLNYYTKYDQNGKPIEIWDQNGGTKYDSKGNAIAKYDTDMNLRIAYGTNGAAYYYDKNGNLSGMQKNGNFTPSEAAAAAHDGNNNTVSITW